MRNKLIASAAAIALAAAVGSASAADQFSTMEGIEKQAMTPQEMGVVMGAAGLKVTVGADGAAARPPVTGELDISAAGGGFTAATTPPANGDLGAASGPVVITP